uniref:Wilms tumor protein 1-interacting protein-like n=1 Tax=Callithrix jacchus TaxID=9483 RepID=UPI0023DCEFEF|nr:Wilms tumor protein 1-interacting protein-like [Callithrix jacchus]
MLEKVAIDGKETETITRYHRLRLFDFTSGSNTSPGPPRLTCLVEVQPLESAFQGTRLGFLGEETGQSSTEITWGCSQRGLLLLGPRPQPLPRAAPRLGGARGPHCAPGPTGATPPLRALDPCGHSWWWWRLRLLALGGGGCGASAAGTPGTPALENHGPRTRRATHSPRRRLPAPGPRAPAPGKGREWELGTRASSMRQAHAPAGSAYLAARAWVRRSQRFHSRVARSNSPSRQVGGWRQPPQIKPLVARERGASP